MPRPQLFPVKKIVGFDQAMIDAIDKWRAKQKPLPNMSEAIRCLVELGLKAARPSKPRAKAGRRSRAAELAASAIEKLIDPSATSEERAQRRRRLTKGPPEFREDRVDLPKAKK
jgi:Arc/MetJ-type ribon-helix-helix transcriptional regulator